MAERPRFGRARAPAPGSQRLGALTLLLVVTAVLFGASRWLPSRAPASTEALVVEVRGEVPAPGFHPVEPPLTVHRALLAAGVQAPTGPDAALEPGVRLVVEAVGVRLEPMDDLLVVGLPIDINRASARALQAIPGIGESRAQAIVEERISRGPFASVDELARVKGIGPKTVETLRPFVHVPD